MMILEGWVLVWMDGWMEGWDKTVRWWKEKGEW
jgi:hypothetical protein